MTRNMNTKGFTILELILLMSMIAILVVVYADPTANLGEVAIDSASRKAQSDIRYAQFLAQTSGVSHGVKFNAGGSYEVYASAPGNPVMDPVTRQQLVEDLSKYPGVTITTNYQVEFEPTVGRPTMGGGQGVRFSSSGGTIRDISVVGQTGAVVIDSTP